MILHFILKFINIGMVQVLETFPHGRQGITSHPSYVVNTMAADDLVTQVARSSATTVLT